MVELLLRRAALSRALGRGTLHQIDGDAGDAIGCVRHVRTSL
jgi:hypothetical protein